MSAPQAAGPSGRLISPSGNTTVNRGSSIHFVYEGVNNQNGVTTRNVAVALIPQGGNRTVINLGSVSPTQGGGQRYDVRLDPFLHQEVSNGAFNLQVTEAQSLRGGNGIDYAFISAAPVITLTGV